MGTALCLGTLILIVIAHCALSATQGDGESAIATLSVSLLALFFRTCFPEAARKADEKCEHDLRRVLAAEALAKQARLLCCPRATILG